MTTRTFDIYGTEVTVVMETAFAAHYVASGMRVGYQRCTASSKDNPLTDAQRVERREKYLSSLVNGDLPTGGGGTKRSPELTAYHEVMVAKKLAPEKGIGKAFPTIESAAATMDEATLKVAVKRAKRARQDADDLAELEIEIED